MGYPLYRLSWDAAELMRNHPPRFRHPHKSLLYEVACPAGVGGSGPVEVTRWPQQSPTRLTFLPTVVGTDKYTDDVW